MKWNGMRKEETMDKKADELFRKEAAFSLTRLLTTILHLAERNLAFRGSVEHFGEVRDRNFLGLVDLLARYDPVMAEHVW